MNYAGENENPAIGVFSGHIGSGKTWTMNRILEQPVFAGAHVVSLDSVRAKLWGHLLPVRIDENTPAEERDAAYGVMHRALTPTMRTYANQIVREEVQRAILVRGVRTIFLDMLMRTHTLHLKPFVDMVDQTDRYLQADAHDHKKDPAHGYAPPFVDLRVVYLFSDLATAKRRIIERSRRRNPKQSARDALIPFWETVAQMDFPIAYQPLCIDTSDESKSAVDERHEIITWFLRGALHTTPHHPSIKKAKACLKEMQDDARENGFPR